MFMSCARACSVAAGRCSAWQVAVVISGMGDCAAAASCALNAAAVSQAEAKVATLKRQRDATLAREIAEETERSRRRINDLQAERDALGFLG